MFSNLRKRTARVTHTTASDHMKWTNKEGTHSCCGVGFCASGICRSSFSRCFSVSTLATLSTFPALPSSSVSDDPPPPTFCEVHVGPPAPRCLECVPGFFVCPLHVVACGGVGHSCCSFCLKVLCWEHLYCPCGFWDRKRPSDCSQESQTRYREKSRILPSLDKKQPGLGFWCKHEGRLDALSDRPDRKSTERGYDLFENRTDFCVTALVTAAHILTVEVKMSQEGSNLKRGQGLNPLAGYLGSP